MTFKILRTISNVGEGSRDLLSLRASIVCEGLGIEVVLRYATVFAESGTAALVH